MRGSTLYICFSLLRHCAYKTLLRRSQCGQRWIYFAEMLQLQHRQLATERRAEGGGGGGETRRKSANLFLCSLSWQLEAEKVGGWEKGDHYCEALFLITLSANVFSIVFPFLIELKVYIPEPWTRSWKKCQRMTSSLKCLS